MRAQLAEAIPVPGTGLKLPLDLHKIASRCSNAYFAPKRFAAVQLAFDGTRCRVLVFRTPMQFKPVCISCGADASTACDSLYRLWICRRLLLHVPTLSIFQSDTGRLVCAPRHQSFPTIEHCAKTPRLARATSQGNGVQRSNVGAPRHHARRAAARGRGRRVHHRAQVSDHQSGTIHNSNPGVNSARPKRFTFASSLLNPKMPFACPKRLGCTSTISNNLCQVGAVSIDAKLNCEV